MKQRPFSILLLLIIVVFVESGPRSALARPAVEDVETVVSAADPLGPHRLEYRRADLVVDLGVGLWAWPLPMDWDGDGDYDLVVSCPDVPFRGTYLFENPGGGEKMPVFEPPVLVGPALAWPKSRKLRNLGEIGIARLLRNFVILGSRNNPRAKERNSGYILVRKGQGIQVPYPRYRCGSAQESRDTGR